MATKSIQFVEKTNNELKHLETMNVEAILKDEYGFADREDGFTQKVIDWYFEEQKSDSCYEQLLVRARKIINYVNEDYGNDWINLTIEEWLILEHTRYLMMNNFYKL